MQDTKDAYFNKSLQEIFIFFSHLVLLQKEHYNYLEAVTEQIADCDNINEPKACNN